MASVLRIVDLNGRTINVIKGRDQSWADVVEKANLPNRFDFCLRHWMSDDPIDTATEEKIKAYLDRVGYILIQDKPDGGIITDYKELRDAVALVPVSGISQLENVFYSYNADDGDNTPIIPERNTAEHMTKAERKIYNALTRPRTVVKQIGVLQWRRENIDWIRSRYPGIALNWQTVDTENVFEYGDVKWRIDLSLPQYKPKNVRGDMLYDMDKVVCATYAGEDLFFDQDYVDITGFVVRI